MKFNWFLPTLISIFLLSIPAQAARLESWRFEAENNRLYFNTDSAVQPKALLIFNPTRLVIDLPGTTTKRPIFTQSLRGNFTSLRIGQFDQDTARIVIELAPGYTIDPQQVKFNPQSGKRWSVDIPEPFPLSDSRNNPSVNVDTNTNNRNNPNRPTNPTRPTRPTRPPLPPIPRRPGMLSLITAIELTEDNQQLLITGNGPINYSTKWESASAYQVIIPSAKLDDRLQLPALSPNSPALISLRQEDAQTVVITIQPTPGVRINKITQPRSDLISLELQGGRPSPTPRPLPRPFPRPNPRPPVNPFPNPDDNNYPLPDRPSVPNGQLIVIIDPGHGGSDPGAIGIDGLREKDIVLPISQEVAQMLEQQGIYTILTREYDYDLELEDRVQIAERANATIFVSIHANAINMSRPDVNGIETYYYESGYDLAQVIHNQLLQTSGGPDRKVRRARFYVLRRTSMPAVLLELGFVTGEDDAPKLADPTYRSELANAIVRGILQYLRGY